MLLCFTLNEHCIEIALAFGVNVYIFSMHSPDKQHTVIGILNTTVKMGLTIAHYGYTLLHNFPCGIVINPPPIEQ